MFKETKRQEIQNSDFSYWQMDANNIDKAVKMFKVFFPEVPELQMSAFLQELPYLMEFDKVRGSLSIPYSELISFMSKLQITKNDGYGEVKVTVFKSVVTKIEAVLREVFANEQTRSL